MSEVMAGKRTIYTWFLFPGFEAMMQLDQH